MVLLVEVVPWTIRVLFASIFHTETVDAQTASNTNHGRLAAQLVIGSFARKVFEARQRG